MGKRKDVKRGNWVIHFGKDGFVVKSTTYEDEYHFIEDSVGWITLKYGDKTIAFDAEDNRIYGPVLVE